MKTQLNFYRQAYRPHSSVMKTEILENRLFKPEEFENAGFSFSWRKTFWKRSFKFLRRRVIYRKDGKHLMRFQGKTSVFKFLRCYEDTRDRAWRPKKCMIMSRENLSHFFSHLGLTAFTTHWFANLNQNTLSACSTSGFAEEMSTR